MGVPEQSGWDAAGAAAVVPPAAAECMTAENPRVVAPPENKQVEPQVKLMADDISNVVPINESPGLCELAPEGSNTTG